MLLMATWVLSPSVAKLNRSLPTSSDDLPGVRGTPFDIQGGHGSFGKKKNFTHRYD